MGQGPVVRASAAESDPVEGVGSWSGRGRAKRRREIGGDDRDRTDDLHNAIVALFQLSYVPTEV